MSLPTDDDKPLGDLLHEVLKLMRRRFEDEAKAYGLTLPQWRILAEVKRGGSLSQTSISMCTDIDPMTVSGVLDRLEKRGLVTREIDPNDSRAKLIRLSPAGTELHGSAYGMARQLQEDIFADLSAGDRAALAAILVQIRSNLNTMSTKPTEKDS